MGLFGRKTVQCQAGEWTTIISNFGTGMPKAFRVRFEPVEGGTVSGTFEERRYFWVFPMRPETGPLKPLMEFRRDWINGIYKVRIRPDGPLAAEID